MKSETLVTLMSEAAHSYKKKTALLFEGREISYAQLDETTSKVAGGLEHLGIKEGDRVAIMLPNIPEFVYAFFGIQKLGAVAVPFNTMYKGREIIHILNDCGARAIITLTNFANLINEVQSEVPSLEHVILTGERTLLFVEPETTVSVQMVVGKDIFPDADEAFRTTGNILLDALKELGVEDAWYNHRGAIRHNGKKIATILVSEIENLLVINSVLFIDDYNTEQFFKVVWVSPEIKDKVLEPMTSIQQITGSKPDMEAFKKAVANSAQKRLGVELEVGELKRDELFGYQKQRSLSYKL
ncbi:MAG: AMP-binding protein [Spirochaeta sp.]|nr:AMP-binding protein [Spirochaeta sp.]